MKYPTTPDGRYFVVKTTLWRSANPALSPARRSALQKDLMNARRQCRKANLATKTAEEVRAIRKQVDDAKVALGERGPIWWEDAEGVGDLNRHGVMKSPYREWFEGLGKGEEEDGDGEEGEGQSADEEKPKPKPRRTTTTKPPAKGKARQVKSNKGSSSVELSKTRTAKKYGLRSADKSAPKEEPASDS